MPKVIIKHGDFEVMCAPGQVSSVIAQLPPPTHGNAVRSILQEASDAADLCFDTLVKFKPLHVSAVSTLQWANFSYGYVVAFGSAFSRSH